MITTDYILARNKLFSVTQQPHHSTPHSTLTSPLGLQYLVLHPLVVVGLVPPAHEVSHQDDDDHGGQDAAHNDGDQVIGALAIGLAVAGGLECIL